MRPRTGTPPRPRTGGASDTPSDRGWGEASGHRPRRTNRRVSSSRKRRKDPLWARLTIVFGALAMVASVLTVAVPKVLASWVEDGLTEFNAIPEELQGKDISGPINFLLLGIDERREGSMSDELIRADSIMLVHIPTAHDRAYMISLPRDLLVDIPANPESGYDGAQDKLAHAFAFGSMNNWERDASTDARERGVALTLRTISDIVPGGLKFNGTAIIDFDGFDKVVEALGSVHMCVDMDVWSIHYWPDGTPAGNPLWGGLTDQPADGPYKSGYYYPKDWCGEMQPWQALDYSRQRYGLENTDYDLQRHQQQLMKAIVEKVASPEALTNFNTVVSVQQAAGELLTLDLNGIPLEDWVFTLSGLRPSDMIMVEPYGGTFRTVESNGISYQSLDPDLVELLESVQNDTTMDFLLEHSDWVGH
jgi:anionic cell wall polymer biosynthesis LytR-Cps2A-Psr (LCP) family protein